MFARRPGKCCSTSQQRKEKEKKKNKETTDKWTCSRMRPLGCSILLPRFPSHPKLYRMTLWIPNDLRTRPIGKTRHHPRLAQTQPLQSRRILICTTSVWETYLVSTACLPHDSPGVSNSMREPDWTTHPAPQTSSTSLTAPSTFFNYPSNFFLPSVPAPYNAMNYGTTTWSPQPGQVPLSTYSTLNGATSSTSQSSSHPSQPNIECVTRLTAHIFALLTHRFQPCIDDSQPSTFIFPTSQWLSTAIITASPTITFPVPSLIFIIYCICTGLSFPFDD